MHDESSDRPAGTRQRDGSVRGFFRRLWPADRAGMRDHLLRLERQDRLLRFAGHVSGARIEAYCAALDWSREVVIGFVVEGEVRGIGELKPLGSDWPKAAEVTLSVEKAYQNGGVGTELLRRLVTTARNRSITVLHGVCLTENGKVLGMMRKLGAAITFGHGEIEARLALPWPDHMTLLVELLDQADVMLAGLRTGAAQGGGPHLAQDAAAGENPAA